MYSVTLFCQTRWYHAKVRGITHNWALHVLYTVFVLHVVYRVRMLFLKCFFKIKVIKQLTGYLKEWKSKLTLFLYGLDFFFAAAHEKITLLWLITICSTVQNHKCFLYVNVKQKPVFYTNNGGVGPPPPSFWSNVPVLCINHLHSYRHRMNDHL